MTFHPNAEKAYNIKAFELVGLIEKRIKEDISIESKGSLSHRTKLDWSSKFNIKTPLITTGTNLKGNKLSVFATFKQEEIGFSNENYRVFKNLLHNVYKSKNISKKVSFEFLDEITLKWIINTYKTQQAESNYCDFLISEIDEVTDNYEIYFEILHLDIEKEFSIGNVHFGFTTPEFITKRLGVKKNNDVFIKEFQGRVFASYTIKGAEKTRVEEIAYKECIKAVDVLKLFSQTVDIPDKFLNFDIDRRVNRHQQSTTFVLNQNKKDDININMSSQTTPIVFGEQGIDMILKCSKNFEYLICLPEPNELQRLLINSISIYSEAISNRNIHKRIVEMFTIWESLLLKNNSVNIMTSLFRYGALILKKNTEGRKVVVSLIHHLYDIRSEIIHHANFKKIDLERVAGFQIFTINLIESFITISKTHSTKKLALKDLDNKIKNITNYSIDIGINEE